MLSKIFITAKNFGEVCRYVCKDLDRAVVLDTEGVRGHDFRLMARDFEWQHQLMPKKEKPVFHGMLSFRAGEDPGDQKMVELARKYLELAEVINTQFAIVKHIDKAHLHMHIIANRVNNEGKPTAKGLVAERAMKAAIQLTREYNLSPDRGKRLELTNLEALHPMDAKRYQLYQAIREALPGCRVLEDLEKALLRQGITIRYRQNRLTGEKQGISFRIQHHSFKGSQVDPEYSLKGLRSIMARQLELEREQEQEKHLDRKQELAINQTLGRKPDVLENMGQNVRQNIGGEFQTKTEKERGDLAAEQSKQKSRTGRHF